LQEKNMALTNTKERYGSVAQIFHWLTALLILGLLIVGTFMNYLPEGNSNEIAQKVFVFSMHKTLGVLVLVIALLRIGWAFINPRPASLHPERKMETFAAETVHWTLYIAILAMPVTGILYHASSTGFAPIWWPFGQTLFFVPQNENLAKIFSAMHWILALGVTLILIAHIGGALKHLIIDKDVTVDRMVPGKLSEDFKLSHHAAKHLPNGLAAFAAVIMVSGALGIVGLNASAKSEARNNEAQAQISDANADVEGEAAWKVIAEQSSLKIRIQQLGSPVEGEFSNWGTQINFDPENLETAFVDARIAVQSLQIGTVSDQAKSADFLNVAEHAQARFTSNDFRHLGDDEYEAAGTLEIAGVAKPFTLQFTLSIQDGLASMTATARVNRMDFGVGAEKYANEDSVAFPVEIIIDLAAQRQ
jgi:cytochrome b561/polyisoprenoid-binding protein YceI